jgi:hypothetical protein
MPGTSIGLVACAAGLFVAFQEPIDDLPPVGAPVGRPRVIVPGSSAVADPEGAAIAGLPADSKAEVLTWDRVYALALIRSRSEKKPKGAPALDTTWLDRESKRVSVADFARFRNDLRAESFRDPAPMFLEVLRRRQAADDALRSLKAHEAYSRAWQGLAQVGAGMPQLTLDQLDDAMQRARSELLARRRGLRDSLDALRVELGLSPEAPVLPDRSILALFGDAFEAADRWLADPGRQHPQLDAIGERLPDLDDITIDGRSIIAELRTGSDSDDALLKAAARVALAHQAGDDERILRVRREVRQIEETYLDYLLARRRFVLVTRELDPGARMEATNLSAAQDNRLAVEDRLVALWTAFQAQRLALLRDLGTLPNDWPGFLAPLSTRKP